GDGTFVGRSILFERRFALAGIKQSLCRAGPGGPKAARPIEQTGERRAFKSGCGTESNSRIVGSLGHTDLGIRLGYAPFGRGDVGTTLEQLGGNPEWAYRRPRLERFGRD